MTVLITATTFLGIAVVVLAAAVVVLATQVRRLRARQEAAEVVVRRAQRVLSEPAAPWASQRELAMRVARLELSVLPEQSDQAPTMGVEGGSV